MGEKNKGGPWHHRTLVVVVLLWWHHLPLCCTACRPTGLTHVQNYHSNGGINNYSIRKMSKLFILFHWCYTYQVKLNVKKVIHLTTWHISLYDVILSLNFIQLSVIFHDFLSNIYCLKEAHNGMCHLSSNLYYIAIHA